MSNERNVETPRRAGSAWSALLEGELAERANDAIQDILSELATWDESLPNGLAGGTAGMALGYHTLARSLGDDSLLERARVAWEESAASLADSASSPAFYGGFPGVAFASAQVASELFGQDADELLCDIDEPLGEFLSHSYVTGNYDLVSGLTGVGVYGLERMPSAAGRRILGAVVRQLMDQTEPEAGQPGRTWKTPGELLPPHQREMAPNGYYNLGVAHGAPAAVAAGRVSTVAVRTIRSLRITCMRTRIRRACSGAASIVAIRRGGPQRGV